MELLDEKIIVWTDSARFVKSRPGIYVLYDKKLEPIYIGGSDNLNNQFSKYLETDFENNACKQKTHTYQRSFTTDHEERKKSLLEKFMTEHGKLPCCNSDSV